ncbi:MAG: TIGR03936 family radical SAM-associated protein [Lachnospiraceae bacterium]|nr:TIGR03936 family radical SAM-associated protein [Lachnospiraceae bacterium]
MEEDRYKIRIRFSKYGSLKFIGHLDVMHFFQQLIRRSRIPICYSGGMSPHQIMSFALPLGTGLTSDGEYVDIETSYPVCSKDALTSLNENSVEGIDILSYKLLPERSQNAMASVKAADYTVRFREGVALPPDFSEKFISCMQSDELSVVKKTKKSEGIVNIRPFIHEYEIVKEALKADGAGTDGAGTDGAAPVIRLKLSTGSVDNTKPELVIKAVCEREGIELYKHALLINRDEMYTVSEDGFVSLDAIGTNIE